MKQNRKGDPTRFREGGFMARRRHVTYSSNPNWAARQAHKQGEREFKTYDTTLIRPKRSMAPTILGLVLALVAVGVLALFLMQGRSCEHHEMLEDGVEATITVPEGATTSDIATMLYDAGLIVDTASFTSVVKETGADALMKPGTYTFVGGTSIDGMVQALKAGPKVESFTVPEGLTVNRTAQLVEEAYGGAITADEFRALASDAQAYAADFPFVDGAYNNSLEGFLFPKTYQMEEGDTADSVIRKMLSQFAQETANLDYSFVDERGYSHYDMLIMASIIEREAAESNRATVSSVFYNRLWQGMPLQSDATVAYVIDGDPTPEDLQIDSPYNTYIYYGLPAGPICSPSIESIQAACAPEQTDYLYFYFWPDENGVMQYAFSNTYEEHQEAIGGTDAV